MVEVTDDMTLPKDQRRQKQIADAPHKSASAKLTKIADKISNIRARILPDPSQDERDDLIDYAASTGLRRSSWDAGAVTRCSLTDL